MTFTNEKAEIRAHEIEKTKAEIQVLTKKLSFLEDMVKHQKSPVEEAYQKVYGYYHHPTTSSVPDYEETRWSAFQKGYNAAYEEKDKPSMTNCVLTGNPPDGYVTWNEWYSEMGSKGILHNLEISSKGILHTLEISSKEYQPTPLEKLKANNWYVDPKTLLKYNWESTQVSAFKYNQRTYIRYEDMGLFAWLIVDKADPIEDVDTLKILENEMNKQKEEYPYKKYTPEETEKGLKDAMKTAKEQGVFDEPKSETLTLKQLLKKWEFDFSGKWAKNMITSELYEEEVERFIQMFMEWMPDAIGDDIQDDWDDGYNSYHNAVMEKLK